MVKSYLCVSVPFLDDDCGAFVRFVMMVQMFGCMLGLHIVFPHRGVSGIVSLGICSDSTKRTRSSFGVFDV